MTSKEINETLARLQELSAALEDEYEPNGGEITETSQQLEAAMEDVKALLSTEGVDSLGRWLKGKEDEAKTIKAEADYITRKRKGVENGIEYVKDMIARVLWACGTDKIKGSNGYYFTATESVTTSVDKDAIKARWQEVAEQALRAAGIPSYITVKLDAAVSAVPEGEDLPDVFTQLRKQSVTFRKPKASKE
jgi:hypothetical protein